MSRADSNTLYVTGFGHGTRARDLARDFERCGRLVRCDIPAPRTSSSRLFAFVEYENRRDAEDAYHEQHNARISRDEVLKIEWARTPPSVNWRFEPGAARPERRDRSPRRSGRSISPLPRRGDSRPRERERERDRYDDRAERRDRYRSRSPPGREREGKDREREGDRARRDKYRSRTPDGREKEKENPRDGDKDPAPNGSERKVANPVSVQEDLDTAE